MRQHGSVLCVICMCVLFLSTGVAHGQPDGRIVAWGRNYHGQCYVPRPNADFVAVAAGHYHSLGLKSDGTIVAWGSDYDGQCNVPAPNADFVAVAGGWKHSLGLKSDGTIVAWGHNWYGQCSVPPPNADFVAVAGGLYHSLGLKSDGTIVAWGWNYNGQCDVPAPNADFVVVAVGREHSVGLKSNGTIVAWGRNYHGQCSVPPPNADFVAVAAGAGHSVGLKSDRTVVAWGWNYNGQCNVPAPNADFVAVAAGYSHTLGVKAFKQPVAGCAFDIKPGSCPNPFNLTSLIDIHGGNGKDSSKSPNKGGVLPTAIVGSESFDVTEVDVSTVLLEGIEPLRHAYEDVTRPVTDGDECACTPEGPDGFVDLTLKFRRRDIADAMGEVEDGDIVPLTITGSLTDGTPFEGSDCVLILSRGQNMPPVAPEDVAAQSEFKLGPIAPNPFKGVTRITYWLPGSQSVKLSVYDATGRLISTLVDGVESAGEHVVEWDAGHMPSGIYFARLQVGHDIKVKRIRLVK